MARRKNPNIKKIGKRRYYMINMFKSKSAAKKEAAYQRAPHGMGGPFGDCGARVKAIKPFKGYKYGVFVPYTCAKALGFTARD